MTVNADVALLRRAVNVLCEFAMLATEELLELEADGATTGWDDCMTALWCDPDNNKIANYAALMHPPLAMVLADLLVDYASFLERYPELVSDWQMMRTARTVLREGDVSA